MNRIQHLLYSVCGNVTVGPEWEDCQKIAPIRAHNACDLELLTCMCTCSRSKNSDERTTQQLSCIVCASQS